MPRFRNLSITRKLTWMTMLVTGGALLLACTAFVAYDVVSFRQSKVTRVSTQAQIVGLNCASALLFNDPQSAENTLAALKAATDVINAAIYTTEGLPLAGYWRDYHGQTLHPLTFSLNQGETHWFKDGKITMISPIVFQGKTVGAVFIESDLQEMYARLKRYAGIVLIVLAASLIAALLFSAVPRRAIAQPIERLAETARIVTREKRYSVRAAATEARDELSDLIEAFNEMLGQIQERDTALQCARDELEQRVQQRTSELEASNKELEAFTYSVSHDLRAPLRHIDGFSKLLSETQSAGLTEEGREYVSLIRESTREMGQLVDDLLNLARISRKEIKLQATGLGSLVQEVVADLAQETKGRTIEWRVARLPFVECDPGLLKQVFANLLSNAVKYSRPRERAVIEVGEVKENGQNTIFVRDNGVGFSMKHSDKLFRVFQRLHRQEDFEGTGVGLATVQRIIHKHGGRVWAEAELDRGATFYFTLASVEPPDSDVQEPKEAGNV